MLRIWYDSPQELEIDRHFARLEELIRTFQPRRVLIDSLSTYSSTLGNNKAKDRFFAVLSHELRTPLTPMLAWTQVLRREAESERMRHAADVIDRNARLQARLVDDLLDECGSGHSASRKFCGLRSKASPRPLNGKAFESSGSNQVAI